MSEYNCVTCSLFAGGTRTTTVKKTETVSKTSGFGGMQYSKPGAG